MKPARSLVSPRREERPHQRPHTQEGVVVPDRTDTLRRIDARRAVRGVVAVAVHGQELHGRRVVPARHNRIAVQHGIIVEGYGVEVGACGRLGPRGGIPRHAHDVGHAPRAVTDRPLLRIERAVGVGQRRRLHRLQHGRPREQHRAVDLHLGLMAAVVEAPAEDIGRASHHGIVTRRRGQAEAHRTPRTPRRGVGQRRQIVHLAEVRK
ncbi:MAG: hypothetical protein L6V80_02460 [Bacteroidales bacterium]|nr:MAG: hypothetical protein L6V80_02460 [Bacteroidales bacterium]